MDQSNDGNFHFLHWLTCKPQLETIFLCYRLCRDCKNLDFFEAVSFRIFKTFSSLERITTPPPLSLVLLHVECAENHFGKKC